MEKITFLNFRKSLLVWFLSILGLPIYSALALPVETPSGAITTAYTLLDFTEVDTDGDGVPDVIDIDDDNDGILDTVEGLDDADGDGIPNHLDIDSDNDGLFDNYEAQGPFSFDLPSGEDVDGNGLDDIYESFPGAGEGIIPIDTDKDQVQDYLDIDSDNDGILDQNESSVLSTDFDCSTVPNLNFGTTPVLESGDALSEGAMYRYQNVTAELDALVVIEKVVNGQIEILDQNDTDPQFFKPEIVFTTTSEENRPYVDFRITLVDSGTDNPVIQEELIANFIDVDGNDRYQEYNRFNTPANYTIDQNNEITVQNTSGGLLIHGGSQEYDGISNQNPSVNVAVEFINIDSFVFRFGIKADVADNFTTTVARQAGIEFGCLDNFIDPQTINFSVDIDSDDDGYPDRLDIDSDNDGIPDNVEAQPTFDYVPPTGNDTDNDGLDDAYEGDGDAGLGLEDTDDDGTPDYLDDDTDNDWVPDNNEGNDFNFDGIPDQQFTGTDTDGDGLDDGYEGSDVNDGFDVNDEIDNPATDLPDRDGTEDVNYRDIDDDGDGIDTPDEDADDNGDPTNDDTDEDGTPDYLDPKDKDTDGDGVTDEDEEDDGTDPQDPCDFILSSQTVEPSEEWNNTDCDGDGVTNEDEVDDGTDPLDPCDYNPDSVTLTPSADWDALDCDGDGNPNGTDPNPLVATAIDDSGSTPALTEVAINILENDDYLPNNDENNIGITSLSRIGGDAVGNVDFDAETGVMTYTPTESESNSTVTVVYQVCNVLPDPAVCASATVTIQVGPNAIDAIDDSYLVEGSEGGVIADSNVLSNDTLNGESVTLEDILLTSTATEELTVNEDGSVSVVPGTPEGTYTIDYTICDITDVDSCDTATVTVEVGPGMGNVIDAVDDSYSVEGSDGGTIAESNVLSNDTLNGESITLEDVLLTSTATEELTVNEDGSVSVAPGTPEGTYTIDYTICDITDVDNCDTATVTVEVGPGMVNVIDAVDDGYTSDSSGGVIAGSDILENDTLNGEPISLIDVILTSTPTGELTVNEDGSVTVASGLEEGDYTIEYTICEAANPDNCDTAIVTVSIEDIAVNQLVTPNGDLKNDFLFIRGIEKIKSSTLKIFNRWGTAVYEGKDYNNINNVFDGRSRAKSAVGNDNYLPAGVYFYIFEYVTDKGRFTDSEYIYISR
ncbi:MAG: gliding motility-associated C-terminal domain-containing protein [Allomuricauda sp.]